MTKPLIASLQDDLNEVIDKYRDQGITLGETIGAIELVKLDLFDEKNEDNEFPI